MYLLHEVLPTELIQSPILELGNTNPFQDKQLYISYLCYKDRQLINQRKKTYKTTHTDQYIYIYISRLKDLIDDLIIKDPTLNPSSPPLTNKMKTSHHRPYQLGLASSSPSHNFALRLHKQQQEAAAGHPHISPSASSCVPLGLARLRISSSKCCICAPKPSSSSPRLRRRGDLFPHCRSLRWRSNLSHSCG